MNLLPHRAWALARKRQTWVISMGLAALVGVLIAVGASVWLARQEAAQRAANSFLQQAIATVDGQLERQAQVQAEMVQWSLRETTLQGLRHESQLSGALLSELAAHLPDGLYVTAVQLDGNKVQIHGAARSDEEVFALLRRMVNDGQWLARPELIEVAATAASDRTPFAMRAWLKRPEGAAGGSARPPLPALN